MAWRALCHVVKIYSIAIPVLTLTFSRHGNHFVMLWTSIYHNSYIFKLYLMMWSTLSHIVAPEQFEFFHTTFLKSKFLVLFCRYIHEPQKSSFQQLSRCSSFPIAIRFDLAAINPWEFVYFSPFYFFYVLYFFYANNDDIVWNKCGVEVGKRFSSMKIKNARDLKKLIIMTCKNSLILKIEFI